MPSYIMLTFIKLTNSMPTLTMLALTKLDTKVDRAPF